MRTTLTLEDDVDRLLRKVCEARKTALKQVVNEALRAGLALMLRPRRKVKGTYCIEPVSLGQPRLPRIDNIAEVLAVAEGEKHP